MKNSNFDLLYSLDRFLGNSGSELDSYITTPVFQFSDPESIQELLRWQKQGIININRINDNIRFNFVDFVWILMIEQMLSVGIPMKVIKEVYPKVNSVINFKEEIIGIQKNPADNSNSREGNEAFLKEIHEIDPNTINKKHGISSLQFIITYILHYKEQVHLIVYPNGDCIFPWYEGYTHSYTPEELERILYETHVKISLNGIVRKFITSYKDAFESPFQYTLSNPEHQLFVRILSRKYDAVSVQLKNKKAESFTLVQKTDPNKKIIEILKEGDFMDVSLSSHNGKIRKIISTHKIQF